jgi:hypothetical protein
MADIEQSDGGFVGKFSQSASAGGAPTARSPGETFLQMVNNLGKRDSTAGPARRHGFVVVASGTGSLQSLQRLCFDSRQTYNTCLTARYRLGVGPILGTLFSTFAEDLLALRSVRDDPSAVGRLKGDLLPMGADPIATTWGTMLQHSDLLGVAEELAGADAQVRGIPLETLDRFLSLLRDESLLPVGHRLVLFCELPTEQALPLGPTLSPGPNMASRLVQEWSAARTTVLDRLPERVGLAFGMPDPITPSLRLNVDGIHQRVIPVSSQDFLTEGGSQDQTADVVERFKPAGLTGDRPAWRDHLGRDRFAKAIARLILHPQTEPLTMGIQAPWGKGKSSFLNLISRALTLTACDRIDLALGDQLRDGEDDLAMVDQEQLDLAVPAGDEDEAARQARETQALEVEARRRRLLEHQEKLWQRREHRARSEIVQVRFNAWRHQDASHIWAGLVSEVSKEVEASLSRRGRILTPLGHALRKRTTEVLVGIVVPTVLAILLGATLYLLGGRVDGGAAPEDVPLLLRLLPGFGVLAVFIWRVYRVVQPLSTRMIDYVRLPDYRDQLGFQTQVLSDLAFLRACLERRRLRRVGGRLRLVREDPKIVVFIDDLDRCPDATVMEVLQTINLILDESGMFVLLAVDTDKIHWAIANQYRGEGAASADPSFAKSYLRKIVQLSFYLPESDPELRLTLVDEQFSPAARRRSGPHSQEGTEGDEAEDTPAVLEVNPDTVLAPRVVAVTEVEDTAEELQTFRALKDFIPDNPRELKRILNTHRFIKILLQRPETPPAKELQRKLVAWLIFCSEWPELVDDVLDLAAEAVATDPKQDCLLALEEEQIGKAKPGVKAFQQAVEKAEVALLAADLEPGSFLARAATSSELIRVDFSPAGPVTM